MAQDIQTTQTTQTTYTELFARLCQLRAAFDDALQVRERIIKSIALDGDIVAQVDAAAGEFAQASARLAILPGMVGELQKRVVMAHGELLRAQWRELQQKQAGGGLNPRQRQDLNLQLSQCRAAAVGYFKTQDPHLIDPMTANFAQAALSASQEIYAQMRRASAEVG